MSFPRFLLLFLLVAHLAMVGLSAGEVAPDLEVVFEGNEGYSDRELARVLDEQIAGMRNFGLTRPRADDTAFFLELYYRRHGYPDADIRWEIVAPERLVLTIDEGRRVELGEITFTGNHAYSDETLREFLVGPTRERFTVLRFTLPLVRGDLRIGANRIQVLYQEDGYLDVRVREPEVEIDPATSRAHVTVAIEEGEQYRFGPMQFEGDLVVPREDIEHEIADILDQPYSDSRVITLRRRLQSYYQAHGYYNASVTSQALPGQEINRQIPVVIGVETGDLFEVAGINVEGLDRIRPEFMKRRFAPLEGRDYNPAALDKVFKRLMRSGLFSDLRVAPKPVSDNELVFDIEVTEAKARELGFSVGYGTFEGFIFGFLARDRNLFGHGRPVTFEFDISQRTLRAELSYEDPWLFNDYNFRIGLAGRTFRFDGYSILEFGVQSELSRQFTRHYEAGLVAAANYNSVFNIDIEPQFVGPEEYLVNSVGMFHRLDYRDNPINPTQGWILSASMEYASQALGSEIDFVRGVFRLSGYYPIGPGILAAGMRGGVIQPLGGTSQLPIDERFFTGGSTTVRSFAERELGPKDRHDFPIGGQATMVLNLEYDIRIIGDLGVAFFVDAGNLRSRSSQFGFGDMRYGVGMGLRYFLPIGPIRIDYGYNPDRRPDEATGALHLSFGFAF